MGGCACAKQQDQLCTRQGHLEEQAGTAQGPTGGGMARNFSPDAVCGPTDSSTHQPGANLAQQKISLHFNIKSVPGETIRHSQGARPAPDQAQCQNRSSLNSRSPKDQSRPKIQTQTVIPCLPLWRLIQWSAKNLEWKGIIFADAMNFCRQQNWWLQRDFQYGPINDLNHFWPGSGMGWK